MLGFGEITIVVLILLGALYAVGFGALKTWNYIVANRRTHRLQREADDREHRKQLAEDYTKSIKMLSEVGGEAGMSYQDYLSPKEKVPSYRLGGKVQ